MPPNLVSALQAVLKGGVVYSDMNDTMTVQRSLPHGHALAALGTARQLGLARILARTTSRYRQLALTAIIAHIINPSSQLGAARTLSPETARTLSTWYSPNSLTGNSRVQLGKDAELAPVSGHKMLAMLDWLRSE